MYRVYSRAIRELGYSPEEWGVSGYAILDDHVPFMERGVEDVYKRQAMAKPALGKGFDALINQNLSRESLAAKAPTRAELIFQSNPATCVTGSIQWPICPA